MECKRSNVKIILQTVETVTNMMTYFASPRLKSGENRKKEKNKTVSTVFAAIKLLIFSSTLLHSQDKNKIDFETCTFKEFPLYGKVKFVESFPDITVQIVDSFPDLEVHLVNSFPDDCGEWQIVESFPDIKIKVVDSFPDIKIKFVQSFPGKP